MATLLANRSSTVIPIATDDEVEEMLMADPMISQFREVDNSPRFGATANINQTVSAAPVLTGAAPTNAASEAQILVSADETWINRTWRPAMGWLYMTTCLFDFILFPIMWSILQAISKGQVTSQWQPLTLQGAGLYHLAMGAVLGVAAYGRTKEKMSGTN